MKTELQIIMESKTDNQSLLTILLQHVSKKWWAV